jgi:hypothetical protein
MPEQVCDDCGDVEDWSPGGDRMLYVTAKDPSGVGLLKIGRISSWPGSSETS